MAGAGPALAWLGMKRGACPETLHLELGGGTAVRAGEQLGAGWGPGMETGVKTEVGRTGQAARGAAQKWGGPGSVHLEGRGWVQR